MAKDLIHVELDDRQHSIFFFKVKFYFIYLFFNFYFYFILLYNTVLVLFGSSCTPVADSCQCRQHSFVDSLVQFSRSVVSDSL